MSDFLIYLCKLTGLTLGVFVLCGFAVYLCSKLFSFFLGAGSKGILDITAVIGTPVHELGHALMCLPFGHKIEKIKLWSPTHADGVYGYVEHTYNRRNLWQRLGCLFIGMGPIFSGLGVTVLMLWLCFPAEWNAYLDATRAFACGESSGAAEGLFSLFRSIPGAITRDTLRSIVGLVVILPVSLHITLSWQDIKSSAGAFIPYLVLLAAFAGITVAFGVSQTVLNGLWLFNLRVLSLFFVVIAFATLWVVLAFFVWLLRIARSWF